VSRTFGPKARNIKRWVSRRRSFSSSSTGWTHKPKKKKRLFKALWGEEKQGKAVNHKVKIPRTASPPGQEGRKHKGGFLWIRTFPRIGGDWETRDNLELERLGRAFDGHRRYKRKRGMLSFL